MPPIKIYSNPLEKIERLKQNATNKRNNGKEPKHLINFMESYSNSKLSIYKYDNIMGIKPMTCEGSTLSIIEDKAYLIGGRGIAFKSDIPCFKIGNAFYQINLIICLFK